MRKQTPLAIIGIFTVLVLALNLVSAATFTIDDIESPVSVLDNVSAFTVSFNVTYTGAYDNQVIDFGASTTNVGSLATVNTTEMNASDSQTLIFTLTDFKDLGNNTMNVTLNGTTTIGTASNLVEVVTIEITEVVEVISGCTNASATNYNSAATVDDGSCTFTTVLPFACPTTAKSNDIEIKDVEDDSDVDDEWNWRPLEKIVITIEDLLNEIGSSDDDAELIIELYFVDSNNTVVNSDVVDDTDDLEDDTNLDNDDKEDVEFNFEIDGDVDEGSYDFYVKVFEDGNEDGHCIVELAKSNVDIEKKTRDVIVKEVDGPTTVKAGETVTFDIEVANLGTKDEDRVKIIAYNRDLDILKTKEIEDLDEGDKDDITMIISIPEDATEGDHDITFSVEFDYDDDDEKFDEESDSDDDIEHTISVLEGVSSAPLIGARLISDAEVGEELEVELAIQNNGKDASFILFVEGYDDWAESALIDDDAFTVDSGDRESTTVTFTPTEAGKQSFTVVVEYDGKQVEQEVTVNVAESTGFLTGAFAGLGLGQTGSYLVGAIVLLAILILVVLIIKLATPRRRVESRTY